MSQLNIHQLYCITKYILFIIFGIILFIILNNIDNFEIDYQFIDTDSCHITKFNTTNSNDCISNLRYIGQVRGDIGDNIIKKYNYTLHELNDEEYSIFNNIISLGISPDLVDEEDTSDEDWVPEEDTLSNLRIGLPINCNIGNFKEYDSTEEAPGINILFKWGINNYTINLYSFLIFLSPDLDSCTINRSNLRINCLQYNDRNIKIKLKKIYENFYSLFSFFLRKYEILKNRIRNSDIISSTISDTGFLALNTYNFYVNSYRDEEDTSDEDWVPEEEEEEDRDEEVNQVIYNEMLLYTDIDSLLKVYCIAYKKYKDAQDLLQRIQSDPNTIKRNQYLRRYIPKKPKILLNTHANKIEDTSNPSLNPKHLLGSLKISKTDDLEGRHSTVDTRVNIENFHDKSISSNKFPLSYDRDNFVDATEDSLLFGSINGTFYTLLVDNDDGRGYRHFGTYKDIDPYNNDNDSDYLNYDTNHRLYDNNIVYMASIGQLVLNNGIDTPLLLVSPTNVENQNNDISSSEFSLFGNTMKISLFNAYTKIQNRIFTLDRDNNLGNNWTTSQYIELDLLSVGCHSSKPIEAITIDRDSLKVTHASSVSDDIDDDSGGGTTRPRESSNDSVCKRRRTGTDTDQTDCTDTPNSAITCCPINYDPISNNLIKKKYEIYVEFKIENIQYPPIPLNMINLYKFNEGFHNELRTKIVRLKDEYNDSNIFFPGFERGPVKNCEKYNECAANNILPDNSYDSILTLGITTLGLIGSGRCKI
jgi:hypothetical protein